MASSIIEIAKRLRNLTANTAAAAAAAAAAARRSLSTQNLTDSSRRRAKKTPTRANLFARISPLGHPSISIAPVLDQWAREGREIDRHELRNIVRSLRGRRRFKHALEVSEWMSSKGLFSLSSADRAVHLNLLGKVDGLDSAEDYFESISDQDEIHKAYGALLNCYVRECLVDKSLSHLQKMKDMGFATTVSYNDIMCLYKSTGQHDKIPDVLSEMKRNGLTPNEFSYKICINSYGERSDLNSMEKILKEMESQPHVLLDWGIYSMIANYYIKAGDREKSLLYLKKCEVLVDKNALGYNHLISHHANLGRKSEMIRLWGLQKANCKKQTNKDYITMLGLLAKLGELEETKRLLNEWESSCEFYDFRVPNILLIGYCQKGLTEKAEATLRELVAKGKSPIPNSWSIVAAGYLDGQNMEKVYECTKEALAARMQNTGWRPKPRVFMAILDWLADNRDVEQVEAFVNSMKAVIPATREMYHALIKAYIRMGKEVNEVLERMKSNNIDVDEETEKILSSSSREK